ncbi:putative exonuclease [Pseudomonas phage BroderSalsa]|nr:putative exonuclease [Pseudomonas phage BroderSalsa]
MIAGIDGDVLRYELGNVAMAREQVFDIFVDRPWPDQDVYALVDKRITDIIERVGADAYEVYLTGPGNYRVDVAKTKPYKGQRVGLEKPYHWETVSRRLKEHWGAITFNGIEADDWLGIRGTEEGLNYTACSRDKDIRQVGSCYHYSWPCGESQPELGPFKVDGLGDVTATFKWYGQKKPTKSWKIEGNGSKFFWGQLLCGDSVDNIPGCKGVGPSKIPDLFSGCVTDEDFFKACVYQYQRTYGDSWPDVLTEQARLLFLIRDRSWLDLTYTGQEVTCKPNRLWEIPYDHSNYFFGAGN